MLVLVLINHLIYKLQLIQINDIQYPYDANFSIDLENWVSNNITIYVIDSRNNSTKLETLIGINFVNYTEKTITNKSCLREGSINEESVLSFSGTFFNSSFGAVDNTLNASYKYKETGSSEWINGNTTLTLTINNNNFNYEGYIKGDTNVGFSADKSFDIQITINDLLSERITTLILAVGEPAIDVYKSNVAFGGIYDELENEYQAQFKKPTNFYAGVYKNGVEIATLNDIPSNLDVYSTDEVKTNKVWIDGKPIYRRVVEFTFSSTLNNWNLITPQTFTSLLKCCGFFKDGTVFMNFPVTNGNEILAVYGNGTTGIYEKHNYSYPNGKSGYLIIEYTK